MCSRSRAGSARNWLLFLALASLACGQAPATDGRPNLLLISIDSLRADHLGSYGYPRDTSPAIDALAASGVRFENAMAQAPWTLPSHASLLTSLYPRSHGATDRKARLGPRTPSLAGALKKAGYQTHAIVSGTFMQAQFGLDAGFESYDDRIAQGSHSKSHEVVTSPDIHERVVGFLDESEAPFFLFVHYWDVHYDYVAPAPYDTLFDPDYAGDVDSTRFIGNPAIRADMDPRDLQHIVALYDGEIAWVDSHIALLMAELERRQLLHSTIVVLTSDHGDEFYEHGGKGHQHSLYQELVHVPLIIRAPGLAPRTLETPVELVDVMPTLLDLMQLPAPTTMQGQTLAPLLTGDDTSHAAEPIQVSETTKARKSRDDSRKSNASTVTQAGRKLIWFDEDRYPPELYELGTDPSEQTNLYPKTGARGLVSELKAWQQRIPAADSHDNEGVDEETRRALEALGYVDP